MQTAVGFRRAAVNLHARASSPVHALSPLQGLLTKLFREQSVLQDCEPGFTSWLQDRGYAADNQKVVIQHLEGQGRGLVATASVQKGSLLLVVPKHLVVFPQTAAEESCLGPLLSQQDTRLPDWSLLALFLAEQQHLCRHGVDSSWTPYIQLLPRPPVGTVLDWTDTEVTTLLAGSGLLAKAHTIRSAADALWQDLQPLITAGKQQQLCPADMFTRSDIQWAVGVCLSRSFRLDDMAGEPVVLVPLGDIANHDVNSEAFLMWDEQQQAVVLRPDRSYKAGEQVFTSYGPKSSGELLLLYGFCPAPGSNPHDAAHMAFSIPPKDNYKQAKEEALAARDINSCETFSVRMNALPSALIPYVAFCAAELRSAAEAEHLAVQLFDEGTLPVLHGVSCEQIALTALAQQCKAALRASPQKQDADKQLGAAVPGGGGFDQRNSLMGAIRVKERQILSRTEFVAQQRVRELRRIKA